MTPEPIAAEPDRPRVQITYCTQCRWQLRATWLAAELLTSFGTELGEVALRPGVGGVFTVRVGEDLVWDRRTDGGFPELGPLKRLVRDRVAPGRDLGHTDRAATSRRPGADVPEADASALGAEGADAPRPGA
jgi:selenoprotein W-related protein